MSPREIFVLAAALGLEAPLLLGRRVARAAAPRRWGRLGSDEHHTGPHVSPAVRWGVLATGGIARAFAADLAHVPDATLVAVGSRSRASADAFAEDFSVPNRHASYEALVADPDVEVVYVAPPHPFHHGATLLALRAGKAVLCEKPFAMDHASAAEMVAVARSSATLLVEAMWTRFLPTMARVREILAAGTLGSLVYLTAEHGQWFAEDPQSRVFAPSLGGGALLDLGIYPLSFAQMVFGTPSRVTAVSNPAFTGVDRTTSAILQYDSGAHAVLTTTLAAASSNPGVIHGTEARLELDGWFYTPTSFRVVSRNDEVLESYTPPALGRGMQHEAIEVGRCLRSGLTESPLMPLDETLAILATMDEIRDQIGLDYPRL